MDFDKSKSSVRNGPVGQSGSIRRDGMTKLKMGMVGGGPGAFIGALSVAGRRAGRFRGHFFEDGAA
jgi:hypothetical protein